VNPPANLSFQRSAAGINSKCYSRMAVGINGTECSRIPAEARLVNPRLNHWCMRLGIVFVWRIPNKLLVIFNCCSGVQHVHLLNLPSFLLHFTWMMVRTDFLWTQYIYGGGNTRMRYNRYVVKRLQLLQEYTILIIRGTK